MKTLSLSLALCAALFVGISLQAEETKQAAKTDASVQTASKPVEAEYKSNDNPGVCIARGLANVTTCWVEIPRCAIYDNSVVPFFGIIVGIPEGALFTTARALTGVMDIVSFGFTKDSMHGKSFPDFVWQAKWAPSESK